MAGDLQNRQAGQDHVAEDLKPAAVTDLLHGRTEDGPIAGKKGGEHGRLILAAVMIWKAVGDLLEAEDICIA
jgi:hypothetical protein